MRRFCDPETHRLTAWDPYEWFEQTFDEVRSRFNEVRDTDERIEQLAAELEREAIAETAGIHRGDIEDFLRDDLKVAG